MKKIISVILTVILCMTGFLCSVSADTEKTIFETLPKSYSVTITDPDDIEQYITENDLTIPQGATLEKIQQTIYIDESLLPSLYDSSSSAPSPKGLVYEIKNVYCSGQEFYYTSEFESDWYQGPATISTTYSQTKTVKKLIGVNIGNSTVSSAVGYDITQSYTVTKSFSTSVASGKTLNVKSYPLYLRTLFDIYNKWSGNLVANDAYTDKAVGLYIVQYTYNT